MGIEQRLVHAYIARHPLEAARAMEELETPALAAVLDSADQDAAHALHLMDPTPVAALLDHVETAEAARLLKLMAIDTQVAVLPLLQAPTRERILQALDHSDAGLLERLLSYPRQTAASLVEYDIFRVPSDITAGEALERSRRTATPVRYYVYVTDRDNRLVGVVSLKQLLRSAADDPVADIMGARPAAVGAADTVEEVLAHQQWRRFPMLPVVDGDQRLLGVILYETIQKLREEGAGDHRWADVRQTLLALSEIYWMGLSTALGSPPERRDEH